VIVVFWKERKEDPFEVYSSLKNFCLTYKQYSYNTISHYISGLRVAFENDEVRVERKQIISKPSEESSLKIRNIVPVVRKVLLKEANDAEHDLDYWLSKTAAERISAVTNLVSESIKRGQRIDKRKIVKRKLKV